MSIIFIAILGVAIFLYWQSSSANEQISNSRLTTQKFLSETDRKMKESEAKRIAEARVKKEAEEKARQEAAARDAAE